MDIHGHIDAAQERRGFTAIQNSTPGTEYKRRDLFRWAGQLFSENQVWNGREEFCGKPGVSLFLKQDAHVVQDFLLFLLTGKDPDLYGSLLFRPCRDEKFGHRPIQGIGEHEVQGTQKRRFVCNQIKQHPIIDPLRALFMAEKFLKLANSRRQQAMHSGHPLGHGNEGHYLMIGQKKIRPCCGWSQRSGGHLLEIAGGQDVIPGHIDNPVLHGLLIYSQGLGKRHALANVKNAQIPLE